MLMHMIQGAGIDPIHFGLVVTLNLALGQQTPPVTSVLITACAVARANIWEVSKINIYFIAVLFAVLMLCTYVPSVPMYLVDVIYRS
ncbi:TRAP transporter large permease subunit [Litorivicinus sp.]|nr:TRAP transporter large permease subunit [Litorivicinus sp.]